MPGRASSYPASILSCLAHTVECIGRCRKAFKGTGQEWQQLRALPKGWFWQIPAWAKGKVSSAHGNSVALALHGAGVLWDGLRLWKVLGYKDSRTALKWITRDSRVEVD